MQIGDRVTVSIPNRKQRIGTIVGEGYKGRWWNVCLDGNKSTSVRGINKDFCTPYTGPDTLQQPTSTNLPHRTITEK